MKFPTINHCGLTVTLDPDSLGFWEYRYSFEAEWYRVSDPDGNEVTNKTHTAEQVEEFVKRVMEETASQRIIYLREEGKRMLEEASRLYDIKEELSLQRQQDRITKQRLAAQQPA